MGESGDGEEGGVGFFGATGGGEGIGADLDGGAFGYAIEGVGEAVGGVVTDFLAAVWVFVIECSGCAETCDEGVVVGRAGCDDG